MIACAIINMREAPNEGRGSVPSTRLSAHLLMDALIRGTCLFGCTHMVSLVSMPLLFELSNFYRPYKIS